MLYRNSLANILLPLMITLLVSFSGFGQSPEEFFNEKDLMLLGSYYYPEQWPEEQWERDIKKMADLGFDFTHYGEFAWARMEPVEGEYNFEWLDKAVALAAKNNMKVIMCTPTPTPPAWLTDQHPDVLMVNDDGRTIRHGARQQASWSSDKYRQYAEKIVTQLAKRYGDNDAVWGWQIDNEPSHYGKFDYSENAQVNFQKWLKEKYKSIEELNKTWGAAFWSLTYNNFEQIRIPNRKELAATANPHAILDFKRFHADEAAAFVLMQQDVLKKYISKDQWVTTNLMADYSLVDPLRMRELDFVTYTKYLVAGFDMGIGEHGFRMGGPAGIGFANDFFRPLNGVTGVMELQPGQVNWGQYNPQTMPGTVRMWIYHVFAGGSEFVCNYRFRQPLSGSEQYHYGILKPNGLDVSSSGEEYIQVAKELKMLRKSYQPKAQLPKSFAARKTAIIYSPDNRWETENQPQTNQWNFMEHLKKYYSAAKSFGAPIDIITDDKELGDYAVAIAPSYQLLDRELVERWRKYAEQGGHLVLTTRTGQKDREGHLWEALFAEPIHELIGAKEIFYDLLPESRQGQITMDKESYSWNNWADIMEVAPNTEIWATYSDQFYKGKAAVISKKLGKGTVTYVGPDTDDGKLERAALKKVYQRAGISILDLPEGLLVEWQHGFYIGLNYSSESQTVPASKNAKVLIGQKELKPAEVVIWQE